MSISPKAFKRYACETLRLGRYFRRPGDGRARPAIPASVLLWAQVLGYLLRESSFLAMEKLSKSGAGREMGVSRKFCDDALSYFTERLSPERTRLALSGLLERAKRNKALNESGVVGFALDGTGAGRSAKAYCPWCHPFYNGEKEVVGHRHKVAAIAVVGCGLTLPFDAEPYGPGDCEYNAGQRLLRRAVEHLGKRFADYVVADGEFATAPFLHAANDAGLHAVARLKDNLPELIAQARQRFENTPPHCTFMDGTDRVEMWDADDFDPWETLRWSTVRVFRYLQYKADGTVVDAYWLTDYPTQRLAARVLYRFAKNRWEIENQVFNDAKNRYGFEHIPHHHSNSLLLHWLLIFLTLCIERLYRLRYLHRGNHAALTPMELLRRLRLSIGQSAGIDTG